MSRLERGTLVYLALVLLCVYGTLATGCFTHSSRDSAYAIVQPVTEAWFTAEDAAINLHVTGLMDADTWRRVVEIRNRGSVVMRDMWDVFSQVSHGQATIEDLQGKLSEMQPILMQLQTEVAR